jgi:SAM-dependent methyltransferase
MRSIRSRFRVALARSLRGRILDCGCGEDLFGPDLRRPGNDLVSLDLDLAALRQVPGRRVCASADRLPFADDTFDGVWSCALVEHVREETLPEMARVIRPGGRLVVVTPNRHSPFDSLKRVLGLMTWDAVPGHVRLYRLRELQAYGRVQGEMLWLPPLAGLFRRLARLAHVWVLDARVTPEVKRMARRRALGRAGRAWYEAHFAKAALARRLQPIEAWIR